MLETIRGIVETQIFYNERNHYGIFLIALEDGTQDRMTITGSFYQIELLESYEFKGRYVEDPRYGLQFKVSSFVKVLPSEKEHVIRYISGPSFTGIGPKSAEAIVEKYGENIIELIQEDPEIELKVKGVSKANLENLKEVILDENPMDRIISFLSSNGITGNNITNIIAYYKEDSEYLLRENPYRLVDEISGIGFKTADKLGEALGFEKNHPYRIEAYMSDVFKEICFSPGHSFIDKVMLYEALYHVERDLLDEAYASLLKKRILIEDDKRLYHYTQFEAEVEVSKFLNHFNETESNLYSDDFKENVTTVESSLEIEFGETQIEALKTFLETPVSIITGGPGTGKSTLLSGIVSYLQHVVPNYHITLCAPTGRAAKRLKELTNVSASTIHSILKWNIDTNEFGFNAHNPLDTDILIVDEFSMVDIWLFSKLLSASSRIQKLLIVGDQDQLPSVGPGFVLKDLLDSNLYPVVKLDYNYRQVKGSEVIDLALNMNKGIFKVEGYSKDVKFFDSKIYPINQVVIQLVQEALNRGYSLFDIQVLAPIYKGQSGIDNLNFFLQKAFNPPEDFKREIKFGTRIYREGDKILQLKNQPDDFVFNGDIGQLVEVGYDKTITVDFDGNFVTYSHTDLVNISHAYCMSVHKAQGSEYPIVMLLAENSYYRMLSRRLYYTAVTRSSKSLILLGDLNAFEKAVLNGHEDKRNTYLKQRLK